MQIKWTSRLAIVAASAAFVGFGSIAQCQVTAGGVVLPGDTHQLTATGKAAVDATADIAQIRFSVECQTNDAVSAQTLLTDSARRAFQALETVGIGRDAIHPSAANVFPIYATPAAKDHLATSAGFRTGEIIEVDMQGEQLAHIGSVVDATMKSGAKRLEGITFDVNPASPQRARLIAQAAQDAQTKAQTMAAALGVQLGSVEDARESGITITPAAGGVNGPLRMEATVTVHYNIGPAAAAATVVNAGAPY
jgi:hypothetical protein